MASSKKRKKELKKLFKKQIKRLWKSGCPVAVLTVFQKNNNQIVNKTLKAWNQNPDKTMKELMSSSCAWFPEDIWGYMY